jgi:phosphoglycerate dehydrogenase-like enzyme
MAHVLIAVYSDIVTWNIPDSHVERLRREFPRHEFVQARDDTETLALVRDAEVAFSSQLYADAVEAGTRLRWVHSPAAGIGSMLSAALIARPIVLTNSRGIHADAMAEHVMGVVIALFRKLPEAFAHQAAHRWGHDAMTRGAPSRLLRGSVVGVIGPGSIGSAVSKLASAAGAHVEVIRRHPEAGAPDGARAVFGPDALMERLSHWDVVVLAAPQTKETRGMIGRPQLQAMKRDAILVNVGRGKLVKEPELIEALQHRVIGGAALDVVEHEPLDPASPLWDLPNVLVTPHTSSLRADYWDLTTGLFAENLHRFDAGQPLLNVVDKHAGY